MPQKQPVILRQIWAKNLKYEFSLIHNTILHFPFISLDTEFPGTIFYPNISKNLLLQTPPQYIYSLMKRNVNALNIVQLGLTLSDAYGNLPSFGTNSCYVWQFNFRDFDLDHHPHNVESVKFLEKQGMNFKKNREEGIDSSCFAALLLSSGIVMNKYSYLNWITFHGCYDLGFLVKILTRKNLPDDIVSFLGLVRFYLGVRVYDVKYMASCVNGLYGGLEKVSNLLGVHRVTGSKHQAGSDSLITLQSFMRFKELYINKDVERFNGYFNGYEGFLYGLCQRMLLYNPPTFNYSPIGYGGQANQLQRSSVGVMN